MSRQNSVSEFNVCFDDPGNPTLNFRDPQFGDDIQMTFGSLRGHDCIAMFMRDNPEATSDNGTRLAFIPREALEIALAQGFKGEDQ